MIFKNIENIKTFTAGDRTEIREILHPKNDPVDLPYSLAKATLEVGEASDPHILKTSSELYIIEKGMGKAFVGEKEVDVKPGDIVLIPAGEVQYIKNTGAERLEFLCVVAPPWSKSDEVIC